MATVQKIPRQAPCPKHQTLSKDFVSLNSKIEPVFRCKEGNWDERGLSHYFTVREVPS